jgi:hypothetical protein
LILSTGKVLICFKNVLPLAVAMVPMLRNRNCHLDKAGGGVGARRDRTRCDADAIYSEIKSIYLFQDEEMEFGDGCLVWWSTGEMEDAFLKLVISLARQTPSNIYNCNPD